MFKKKKPLARVENVKMAGAFHQQNQPDYKKVAKLCNPVKPKKK